MTKPKDADIIKKLDQVAIALLDDTYGHILDTKSVEEAIASRPSEPLNPNTFNAAVGWVRVRNKLDIDDGDEDELGAMISGVTKRGKR